MTNCRSLLIAFGLDLESTRYCDCKTSETVDNNYFFSHFLQKSASMLAQGNSTTTAITKATAYVNTKVDRK